MLPSGEKMEFLSWTLQTIVKQWRNHSEEDMRVDNMVAVKMPMVTFVRFGQFKKHKSKILNQILSPQGQHHSFFWHDELRDGSVRLSSLMVWLS